MITPEMPPPDGDFAINQLAESVAPQMAGAMPKEDCVSLTALAMPDDGDRLQNPVVGDVVNYQVTGKIARIEGDKAYVTKETVNGQAVEPDADNQGGAPDGDADDLGKLEADAQTMGAAGGY